MTAGWRNISLVRSERYAYQFIQLVEEACISINVAGEIRRRQDVTSSPIEVVAVPITCQEYNLFGEQLPPVDVLMDTLKRMLSTDRLSERIERRKGSRKVVNDYPMKLLFQADSGMLCPIDLWMTTEEKFGAVLALRTGPYGFRSRLVAPLNSLSVTGGAGLLHREMQLDERNGLVDKNNGETLRTPTEQAFFDIVDVRMVPPEQRR